MGWHGRLLHPPLLKGGGALWTVNLIDVFAAGTRAHDSVNGSVRALARECI